MIPAGIASANPVALYCLLFKQSGATPLAFAQHARAHFAELVSAVLDIIGMHPSSEPELAALQRCAP